MQHTSVLLIEDDRSTRELIQSVLETEGYPVLAAKNGKEGLEAIGQLKGPRVVLLDMMMPVMNGWEFLDHLRSDPSLSKIPVVVVSAYEEIAKSVRPKAYVSKPIQLNSLLNALSECTA